MKTTEDQREKKIKVLEQHGKQLVNSSREKGSPLKQTKKETITNERMDEIQNLRN